MIVMKSIRATDTRWMDHVEMAKYFDMDIEAAAGIRIPDNEWLIVRQARAGFWASIHVVDGLCLILRTFPTRDAARRFNLDYAGL